MTSHVGVMAKPARTTAHYTAHRDLELAARTARPRLQTIAFSHYCELARWALDARGIDYDEVSHLPGFGFRVAAPRTLAPVQGASAADRSAPRGKGGMALSAPPVATPGPSSTLVVVTGAARTIGLPRVHRSLATHVIAALGGAPAVALKPKVSVRPRPRSETLSEANVASPPSKGAFLSPLSEASSTAALGPPLAAVGVRDQGHGGGAQCIRLLFQVPEK